MICGAGAAGLTAAIFAAETAHAARAPSRIVVLESAPRIGAKILISGGGRCNVTHHTVEPDDFNGPRPVVRNVLAAFDAARTVEWFASLGVSLKREETGKLFPVSDRARTVVDALVSRCRELGVTLTCGARVTGITPASAPTPRHRGTSAPNSMPTAARTRDETDGRSHGEHAADMERDAGPIVADTAGVETAPLLTIAHSAGIHVARAVVLATGGRSLPRTGSDGHGWQIARRLGHTVTSTHPALVPLVLDDGFFHAGLAGLSQPVELSTFAAGRLVDRRVGSLLWTHFGVSGPVVMDASRHWTVAHAAGAEPEIRCSFFPGARFEDIERSLLEVAAARPRLSLLRALGAPEHAVRLPERLAAALLAAADVDATATAGELSRPARRRLVHVLGELRLPIVRERGWNHAEVTAGGVPLAEIDYRTMASRKQPGLYLAGEMLDCDGRIGGFNFQWAWATGFLAGRAAAQAVIA